VRSKARIAYACSSATDEDDGLVASPLKSAQDHDRKEMSDMQAVGRGVETYVCRHDPLLEGGIDASKVRGLVNVSALDQRLEHRRTRSEQISGGL
jgi:hypothetical protein